MLSTQIAPPKFVEVSWTQNLEKWVQNVIFWVAVMFHVLHVALLWAGAAFWRTMKRECSLIAHLAGTAKNLEKAPSLSNLLISQRPPRSFIIKLLIENSQHLSHCSTTLWLFKCILGHHSPTKCSEPAGFTHLPSTSLVVSTLLQNFVFYVSFYVQNTFFRVMGNFVFSGIQRPDSSSSSSERRYGPVLWVRGYSCVTGSSWWTLATHLGWNKGVGEHLAGEVPIGTVLSKRKEAV